MLHGLSSEKGDAEPVRGYYSEVAIDPATDTILRLTVEADLGFEISPILRGDIMGGIWSGRDRRQDESIGL
jgi:hypothetical protein